MDNFNRSIYFPSQRVSDEEKSKPEWYANAIDFIISAGTNCNDKKELENKINICHGNIPTEYYKKTLNPYNSNKQKYLGFPATMRNLDIMKDILRRYVSEYIKGIHEFVVGANNPDIVINKNAKLKTLVTQLAQEAFAKEFEAKYQQMINSGSPVEEIDTSSIMPDIESFIKDFNDKYIDEQSEQSQQLLDYIQDMTDDELLYVSAYLNYVAYGECYTYSDIRGNKIYKESIPLLEAYPIPNTSYFAEDYDMFARRKQMTYQQVLDFFKDDLKDKDIAFLKTIYDNPSSGKDVTMLRYDQYFESYSDICSKFSKEERQMFKSQPVNVHDNNNDLIDVWHVTWRGEAERKILSYINEIGFVSEMIVDDDFVFDAALGHLEIKSVYESQVYEGYRIGTRYSSIYPIKCRPIKYNRNGKLPYNGLAEILPQFGKFSIVEIVTPFQVLRNIISYHREMVIAKNKLLIMIMPESLLGNEEEDKIYKMAADGVMYYDDSNDANSLKAQQIRMLNANIGNYISELTGLMEAIKQEARELVDMTAQRYGQIGSSAGKSVTEEAIIRGSMGSVIITFTFDKLRCKDYNRDLDYGKLAFIDGLDSLYFNNEKEHKYLSLDVNSFINSDLSVTVRNNVKELEKVEQLRQWAFSAAQNGDLEMALAAITGDNVSSMKKIITKFSDMKRQHEDSLREADRMLEESKITNKLKEIAAKGEEDRKTEEVKQYFDMQSKYVDFDLSVYNDEGATEESRNKAMANVEQSKREVDKLKLQLEAQKLNADMYNKAADRNVAREKMQMEFKIAKTNKNKYDSKSKK